MTKPETHTPRGDDPHLQTLLGNVLRTGVLTAAAVVLLGGIFYLVRYGASTPNYSSFQGASSDLRSVSGIIGDVLAGSSQGVIQLGLVLLIATPVMRVALALIGFARQGDRTYMVVSLTLLLLLLYSLFDGRL